MKKSMIEAFELKRKGYYKQAIEIYYKLLSKVSDDVEILTELADLYYLLHNNERAIHYIVKSLELKPDNISTLKVLCKVYLSENDLGKAEDIAKKIYSITNSESDLIQVFDILETVNKNDEIVEMAKTHSDTECLYRYALALYKLKRYDEGVNILENILAQNSLQSDTLKNATELMAKIYYEQNNTERAKEVFKKLEDMNVETGESFNYVGLNKLDELKLDEAIEYFKKAVAEDSKNPQYIYNMGQAYFLKGWIDEAKECFNTAICLNPTEEKYHYSMAYLFYKIGNYEMAKSHLDTEHFESKVLLQVIKAEEGNLASSKVELEKMLNESPENETILFYLSKIYFKLDMYKQARTLIDKVLELNNKSFDYQAFRIKIMLKTGDIDEAEKVAEELINKYPNYYFAHVLEAEINLEQKDYDSLFETAQELIELDINHYEGYYYNALALFEQGDVNFAIESLKKAISLDVNNADLYVKMGEFYQAIGRLEDAFEYIKEASDIDKSAKNKELYMQLAGILRRKGLSS